VKKTDLFRQRVTEDPVDPGFGAKVSNASQRLLNRDGTFNARRSGLSVTQTWSPFHDLLNMSWRKFVFSFFVVFMLLNLTFAVAYALCGPQALSGPNVNTFGSLLLDWEQGGAIRPRAKACSILLMNGFLGCAVFFRETPLSAKVVMLSVMIGVSAFILSRPSAPSPSSLPLSALQRPPGTAPLQVGDYQRSSSAEDCP